MFRILTERKNVKQIRAAISGLGLDTTIYPAVGTWRGVEEKSLVIEFAVVTKKRAKHAARLIKVMNKQQAVLLQEIPVVSEFI